MGWGVSRGDRGGTECCYWRSNRISMYGFYFLLFPVQRMAGDTFPFLPQSWYRGCVFCQSWYRGWVCSVSPGTVGIGCSASPGTVGGCVLSVVVP